MGIYDIKDDCRHPKEALRRAGDHAQPRGQLRPRRDDVLQRRPDAGIVSAVDTQRPDEAPPDHHVLRQARHPRHDHEPGRQPAVPLPHQRGLAVHDLRRPGHSRATTERTSRSPRATGMGIYDISAIQSRKENPQVKPGQRPAVGRRPDRPAHPELPPRRQGVRHRGERGRPWRRPHHRRHRRDEADRGLQGEDRDSDAGEPRPRPQRDLPGFTKERGGDLQFGYNFHYCNIDKEENPNLLACSAFEQGFRLYDIRDVPHPKEIAYYNNGGDGTRQPGGWGRCTPPTRRRCRSSTR